MIEQLWFVLAMLAVAVLGREVEERIGVPSTVF
jgi:hypothetical protein